VTLALNIILEQNLNDWIKKEKYLISSTLKTYWNNTAKGMKKQTTDWEKYI
jgi:hypothetical protein